MRLINTNIRILSLIDNQFVTKLNIITKINVNKSRLVDSREKKKHKQILIDNIYLSMNRVKRTDLDSKI